jgi:hypothetical protein
VPNGGFVSFYNGAAAPANLLGVVPLSAGTADFSTSALSVAHHTITAVYSGASGFVHSSGAVVQAVAVAGTLTGVSSSASPGLSFGQAVTFTANVSSTTSGAGTPTGSVRFYDGTTLLGAVPLNVVGSASISTSSLAANPAHSITAVYAGSAHFGGSTSATLIQPVAPANTAVNLTQSVSAIVVGVPITFSASVSAASGGIPTGSVTFVIDRGAQTFTQHLVAGKATLKFAGFTTNGAHTVSVTYNPAAGNFAKSSSQTDNVNVLAVSTVILNSSARTVIIGQSVTFTAAVSGNAGTTPTGLVSFYDGARLLGTASLDAGGEATITVNDLNLGTNKISAIYLGDQTYFHADTITPLSQVVEP